MTPGERIVELFTTLPPPGSNLDWLTNGLLAVASEAAGFTLRIVPVLENGEPIRRFQVEESGRVIAPAGRTFTRIFRPLLARLAVIAAEETNTQFQPYGGRYSLIRSGPDGTARLDVEFSNTPSDQCWSVTRTLLPTVEARSAANGVAHLTTPAAH